MHSKKTTVPTCRAALAAALAAFLASAAGAVSLGDLKVESAPGEPFDAVLEIHDVDFSVSPLLVRIAPAATYEREGIEPPEAAGSLRLTRDANPGGVRVRVAGDAVPEGRFPLLIELNAGGAVTLRRYEIVSGPEGLWVEPVAESTHLGGALVPLATPDATVSNASNGLSASSAASASSEAPAAASSSTASSSEPKADNAVKAEKTEKTAAPKPRKKGRYGPRVVREYVALNGFDAHGTFPIRQDMTFWSIAKLYWPRYEGATMEQLAVGFLEANPKAFTQGDLNLLVVGETLVPPSEDAVFAIDPEEAFRRMRGPTEAIPLSTRNLAEAQMVSRECAAAVGAAQNAKRDAGGSALEIAEAGRQVFEEYKAKLALQRELQGDVNAGRPAVLHGGTLSKSLTEGAPSEETFPVKTTGEGGSGTTSSTAPVTPTEGTSANASTAPETSAPVDSAAATSAEPSTQSSTETAAPTEQAASTSTAAAPDAASSDTSKDTTKDAPEDASKASATNTEEAADKQDFLSTLSAVHPAWYLLAAIVLVLLFLLRGRKNGKDSDGASAAGGSCSSEGCGSKGPQTVQLQKKVAPTSAAQLKAVEATVGEAVKNGTTAGAMGAGSIAFTEAQMEEDRKKIEARTAEQPWLDPKSDELPPVDEEAMRATVSEAAIEEAVSKIDLTLPHADARPTVVVTEEELPTNDYIPPLMPEPVGSEKTVEAEKAEKPEASAKDEKAADAEGSTLVVEVETERDILQKPVLRPASAVPPSLTGGALPPESEARIEAIAKAAAQSVEDIPAPAAAPAKSRTSTRRSRRSAEPKSSVPAAPKAPAPNAKEEALGKSIEAKLKLANSFVGLGALQEARELLVEVKKHGTPEQKARAEFLEERIGKA
ncbi:FimV/HubP-related protein [Sutterella megalosphaeroides]|uniref:FimV N-terminal domain-containing protein n=1 Tax=Sutterella megalosphaeroides TaxID=2494234 RepID=A0A2Z6IBS5_9BURK|nr:hypothetical protein [Sutterella megalosphaeroides]BBF23903.1 hypothetical protein SUTMEG_17940 [Sutterella megalosphaeroides]